MLYSARSGVNWAFFGTRGALKRSFHSCQKKPNLHTNPLNKPLLLKSNVIILASTYSREQYILVVKVIL
jgi:hypothetical protein